MDTSRVVIRSGQRLADVIGENNLQALANSVETILLSLLKEPKMSSTVSLGFRVTAIEVLRNFGLISLERPGLVGESKYVLTEQGRKIAEKVQDRFRPNIE